MIRRLLIRSTLGIAIAVSFLIGITAVLNPVLADTYSVTGAILQKQQNVGGVSVTGSPTSQAFNTPPRTGLRGIWQEFDKGDIFYSRETGAAWVPKGPLLTEFFQCGFFCYGLPKADVQVGGNGSTVLLTQYGGNLYYSPVIGVQHILSGGVLNKYSALGGTKSFLGLPVTGLQEIPGTGGSFVDFQWGSIYSSSVGSFEVHGGIKAKWKTLGGPTGELGFPTSDELSVPGGRKSTFENGELIYNASTNTVSVVLY